MIYEGAKDRTYFLSRNLLDIFKKKEYAYNHYKLLATFLCSNSEAYKTDL